MKLINKINAFILGAAILLAAGCGKNDNQNDPAPENQLQKNCQLSAITSAVGTADFAYNSSGKLIEITNKNNPNGKTLYSYFGNKEVVKIWDNNSKLFSYKVIIFNSNNMPDFYKDVQYFASGDSSTSSSKYTYNAARQLIKATGYWNQDTASIGYNIYSYPAADQVLVASYHRNANGSFDLRYTWRGHFDNMNNPYLQLGIFKEELLYSKHNLIKVIQTDYQTNTISSDSLSYDYNEAGFPTAKYGYSKSLLGWSLINGYAYNCQ